MTSAEIEPFEEFRRRLVELPTAGREDTFNLQMGRGAVAPAIKAHLLDYYADVAVEHSFADEDGVVYDCVPIDRQPAAGLVAGIPDQPFPDDLTPDAADAMAERSTAERCPDGTVPIQRLTTADASRYDDLMGFLRLGDGKRKPPTPGPAERQQYDEAVEPEGAHRYAVGYQRIACVGGRSAASLWRPAVAGQAMSLSQIWMSAGLDPGETIQTAEAGWQVCLANFPQSAGKPVFFIYWTADDYGATGAYNNRDGKFFVKSSAFAIGGTFDTCSVTAGAQYDLDVAYYLANGNWWLYVGGAAIGFWPGPIYNGGAMTAGAREVMVGGETSSAPAYPPMGSGERPATGFRHAAYHRNATYYDAAHAAIAATLTPYAPTPGSYEVGLGAPAAPAGADWGTYIYFGGPGGA